MNFFIFQNSHVNFLYLKYPYVCFLNHQLFHICNWIFSSCIWCLKNLLKFSFFWDKEPGFFSHIKDDKLYIISNLVMVSQTLLNFYMSDSVRQRPQIALATVKDWVFGTFHQLLYNTCHCQNQVQKSFPWVSACNYTKLKRIVAVAIFINCWSKTLYVSKSVWVYFLFFV